MKNTFTYRNSGACREGRHWSRAFYVTYVSGMDTFLSYEIKSVPNDEQCPLAGIKRALCVYVDVFMNYGLYKREHISCKFANTHNKEKLRNLAYIVNRIKCLWNTFQTSVIHDAHSVRNCIVRVYHQVDYLLKARNCHSMWTGTNCHVTLNIVCHQSPAGIHAENECMLLYKVLSFEMDQCFENQQP